MIPELIGAVGLVFAVVITGIFYRCVGKVMLPTVRRSLR